MPVSGIGRGRDAFGSDRDLVDLAVGRVIVLDRATGRASVPQRGHGLGDAGRVIGETALRIDVEWKLHRRGDRRDMGQQLVARDGLVDLAE